MHTAIVLLSYRAHRVTFQRHWVQQEGTYLQAFKHYTDTPMTNSGIVILMTTQKVILQECCLTCTPTRNLLPLLDKIKNNSWMKPLREHLQLNDSLHLVTKSKLPVIQRSHQSAGQQLWHRLNNSGYLYLVLFPPISPNKLQMPPKTTNWKGSWRPGCYGRLLCSIGLCPRPTHDEYVTMAVTLYENFLQLKDKKPINGAYWVSRSSVHIHACFSHTI